MKKYQKIILSAVVLLTLYCISVFVSFAFSGRKDARKMDEARRLFAAGNYEKARPVLSGILTDDPSNETACLLLAEIFETDRNYPMAAVLYQRVVSLNPFEVPLRSKLAVMLSVTGGYGDILKLLGKEFDQKTLGEEELLCYLEALSMTGNRKSFEANLPVLKPDSVPRLTLLYGIHELDQKQYAKALGCFDSISTDSVAIPVRYKALSLGAIAAAMLPNEPLSEAKLKSAAELVPVLGAFPLATFYLNRNNPAEALVWLKECLKTNPGHTGAKLDMIDIYASDKDVEQLRKLLASFVPHSRDDQECSNYLKAAIALYEKRYKEVLSLLEAAPHILNRLGYQSMNLEARIALQDVYRIPENVTALTRLSDSVQVRQHIHDRLYPLLVDLVKQEKSAEADTVAAVLIPMMDNARFPAAESTFKMLLLSAMKRNDYQKAMDYSAYLLRNDPKMPLANLTMGEALIAMKRPDKALVYLKAVPDSLSAFYDRARAYALLKDDQKAEQAYRTAWAEYPGDVILFSAYADFLFAKQRFTEIKPLIAAMPDSPDAKYAISTIQAKIADRTGDKKESVRLYSEALELLKTFPESDENLYRQAYLYALTGQDAKAGPIYRRLLEKMPNSIIMLLNLSEVEAALGNHQEAMARAETAARLYPESQEVKDCLNRRKAEASAAKSGN